MLKLIEFLFIAIFIVVDIQYLRPMKKYKEATNMLSQKDYSGAYETFKELEDYENSSDMMLETKYQEAIELIQIILPFHLIRLRF